MYVESVALKDFRNYEVLDLDFSSGINIIYGDNAQGKTNIIESLYMCATSKSHRGSKEAEMIRFGCDQSHIRSIIKGEKDKYRIDINLRSGGKKGIAIDRIPVKRSADLFGKLNMICFSPEDLSLIKKGPSYRRRFMDMEICQLSSFYLYNLSRYSKVINQRNSLLKQIKYDESLKDTLDVWDMQLIEYGKIIIEERKKYLKKLAETAAHIHKSFCRGKEDLKIIYKPSCEAEDFEEKLFNQRESDLRFFTTGTGPHRDDFIIKDGDKDLRIYGSQGQQRTAALSLKISEIEIIRKNTGRKPVLLLDDVLSELDKKRQTDILKSLEGTQTIITCTDINELDNIKIDKAYKVKAGKVSRG